jgi:16S rRNA (cytidine1402-2'-O)-methyltransferase
MSLETKAGPEPIGRNAPSKPADVPLAPGLYLVATPIGNAEDITLRALRVLRGADLIACEDTRVSAKLMVRFDIGTRRIPYHDHNAERMRPRLLARLAAGARVALISDAGMPLVSDPGFTLVRGAIEAGCNVTVVPGASAPLAALTLAGVACERFLFAGFLPAREAARRRVLADLAAVPASLVFFETAPRLALSLADMASVLGDRPAAVARELTKLHEEVRRATLGELARHYRDAGPPKGEIVVVTAPPAENAGAASEEAVEHALETALATMSVRDASEAVATALGLPRRTVYARALARTGRAK